MSVPDDGDVGSSPEQIFPCPFQRNSIASRGLASRHRGTDQDYEGQVERLKAAGCERVFSEKVSGKSQDGRGR